MTKIVWNKTQSFHDNLKRSKYVYESQMSKMKEESSHMQRLLLVWKEKFIELESKHPGIIFCIYR